MHSAAISMFSPASSYAIRALTYLAVQPRGRRCGAKEISAREDIPGAFLSKLLVRLRRGGVVRAWKGVGGGYELAIPAEQITLLRVMRTIDPETDRPACLMDHHPCGQPACPMHAWWANVRGEVFGFLDETTIAKLVETRPSDLQPQPRRRGR